MAERTPPPRAHQERVVALAASKLRLDDRIWQLHVQVAQCCPRAALPHEYCAACKTREARAQMLCRWSDAVLRKLEAIGAACAKCHELIEEGTADADRLCPRCAPTTCERCFTDLQGPNERAIGACAECWHDATGTEIPDAL